MVKWWLGIVDGRTDERWLAVWQDTDRRHRRLRPRDGIDNRLSHVARPQSTRHRGRRLTGSARRLQPGTTWVRHVGLLYTGSDGVACLHRLAVGKPRYYLIRFHQFIGEYLIQFTYSMNCPQRGSCVSSTSRATVRAQNHSSPNPIPSTPSMPRQGKSCYRDLFGDDRIQTMFTWRQAQELTMENVFSRIRVCECLIEEN